MSEVASKSLEERIDEVLDRLRPFLQREGGDIHLDHFDENDGTAYVDMTGACSGCYLAADDVSDSVEVLLMDEVPEIKRVLLVQPKQPTMEEMLAQLKAEEQANRELEEYNKTHPQKKPEGDK